jgi:hypothetical protein
MTSATTSRLMSSNVCCGTFGRRAWVLARDFLVDEQTCKMQGKSEYKTHCGKFKRLGDGLQGDCIADDGYMWDFYFRNEPCDPKLLANGYCPMHC